MFRHSASQVRQPPVMADFWNRQTAERGRIMEKAQLPVFAELSLGDTEDFTGKPARKFIGTENPRQLRTIHRLLISPLTREHLDRTAGASNGPELVAELRR